MKKLILIGMLIFLISGCDNYTKPSNDFYEQLDNVTNNIMKAVEEREQLSYDLGYAKGFIACQEGNYSYLYESIEYYEKQLKRI